MGWGNEAGLGQGWSRNRCGAETAVVGLDLL